MNREIKEIEEFFSHPSAEGVKIKDFAESLMKHCYIQVGTNKYQLEEIEIYLYCNEHKDTNVYPRVCEAQQFFIHYSGFDIAFQTKKDGETLTQFGGVLVRSLKKNDSEMIFGPMRCLMEIFNQKVMPTLDFVEQSQNIGEIERTHRVGIKEISNEIDLRFRTIEIKDNISNSQEIQTAYKVGENIVEGNKKIYYKPIVE